MRTGQIQANRFYSFTHPRSAKWGVHPAGQAGTSGMTTDQLIAALGQDAANIANNIASQIGQTDRANITATAQAQYAQLLAQQQAGNTSPAIQQQLDTLTTALARLGAQPASGMSTGTVVAIVAGGVLLLGGMMYMTRSRHNPTEFRRTKRGYRAKRFVPASWLK